ncbi:MAG: adenine deaminase [Methanosphaera sp.]|nr:adenine deaminase [Methanosphaera sp.]
MYIKGNILNVITDEIYPGEIQIEKGRIISIKEVNKDFNDIIVPGFIDAHIHIESSMLTPSRFAEIALRHGTTAVVSDPHEIANVLGMEGIEYMVQDASFSPLHYYFTAPSCVPSTKYETSGATLTSSDIENLFKKYGFVALSEVMDYESVINNNPDMMDKLNVAKRFNKPIDGHAPLLTGKKLQKYILAGITTDHESVTKLEVEEKRRLGMKIMVREGSESKTLEDFIRSKGDFLVTDDLKAEDLIKGHLNVVLRKAVDLGMDPFEALRMVTINPAEHYGINAGFIGPGRNADLVFIDNLDEFNVKRVIINGNTIYKKQKLLYRANPREISSGMNVSFKSMEDFNLKARISDAKSATVNVIDMWDNKIVTGKTTAKLNIEKGNVIPSVFNDVLKISVVERYGGDAVFNAFIRGFGIKNGAVASSVAHDSHNILVVGTDSKYMAEAVNTVISNNGGISAISNTDKVDLALPVAGLMSDKPAHIVAKQSQDINTFIQEMGSNLNNPISTLSFMALPVIPSLKITDKGLFDVEQNQFIDVVIKEE